MKRAYLCIRIKYYGLYMKKKYLRICNEGLLYLSPVVLSTGILLEILHGKPFCGIGNAWWTWLHMVVSFSMAVVVIWHVWLNWPGVNGWYRRFRTHRSPGFKSTVVFYLLTVVSGVAVVPLWLHDGHIGIGGVHGKIGFAAAVCLLFHIVKRRRWYCKGN